MGSDLRHSARARVARLLARHGWVADLADDPIARASLAAWYAQQAALAGGPALQHNDRTRNALQAARYFGLPETGLAGIESVTPARPAEPDLVAETLGALVSAYAASEDDTAADAALANAVRVLRRARRLTRELLARMRGDRANWALQQRRFDQSAALYCRVQRSFRTLQSIDDALNAMAGEARALGRAGQYGAAVQVFEQAIGETAEGTMRANLLLGLGSAHLMEATERRDVPDVGLIDKAVEALRDAVDSASLNSGERASVRLALARALGEKGEQQRAMDTFDQAVAELAHLGSPNAKLLLELREQFVAGFWRTLSLY